MNSKVKCLFVDNPENVEDAINKWLEGNDVDIHYMMPYPLVKEGKASMMIMIFYAHELWKG